MPHILRHILMLTGLKLGCPIAAMFPRSIMHVALVCQQWKEVCRKSVSADMGFRNGREPESWTHRRNIPPTSFQDKIPVTRFLKDGTVQAAIVSTLTRFRSIRSIAISPKMRLHTNCNRFACNGHLCNLLPAVANMSIFDQARYSLCEDTHITDATLQMIGERCPDLKSLVLDWTTICTRTGLIALATGCSKLAFLEIGGMAVDNLGLRAIVNNCPLLRVLHLKDCELQADTLAPTTYPKGYDRSCWSPDYTASEEPWFTNIPALMHLEDVHLDLPFEQCQLDQTRLECYLDNRHSPIHFRNTDGLLAALSHCGNLKSLGLTHLKFTSAAGLWSFVSRPHAVLTNLNLSETAWSQYDPENIGISDDILEAVSKMNQLTKICLYQCDGFTHVGLGKVVVANSLLTIINLSKMEDNVDSDGDDYQDNVTNSAMEVLGSACPGLLDLNISNNPGITEVGIAHLSAGCKQLQTLNIGGCCVIEAAFGTLAKECTSLTSLVFCFSLIQREERYQEEDQIEHPPNQEEKQRYKDRKKEEKRLKVRSKANRKRNDRVKALFPCASSAASSYYPY
jgi:hypothetical protein